MVDVKSLISFNAIQTENIRNYGEVQSAAKKMVDLYSKSLINDDFSFRILLPRSKDAQHINDLSKKLGIQLQNELLLGIRKLKLRPNIKEFRYIHDEDHYGWLLISSAISEDLV